MNTNPAHMLQPPGTVLVPPPAAVLVTPPPPAAPPTARHFPSDSSRTCVCSPLFVYSPSEAVPAT
jgi:hypothetical protein